MNTRSIKTVLTVLSLLALAISTTYAQPPDTLWTRTFGGSSGELGFSVQQTADGGYIIAGITSSYGAGSDDVWLIKTDANGDSLWTRTFGGSHRDHGSSVQQTTDGGYIIAGWTASFGAGGYDVWLIKTDSLGSEQWNRTFGGSDDDRGYSVQQTTDGGYIVAATTLSYGAGDGDVWLIKTDANGNQQWSRTFGGSSIDRGRSVLHTTDGGYIIVGETVSYGAGGYDVWLIKTDANGIEQWNRTFGGTSYDQGHSVQHTTDGGYIIAGWTVSYGAGSYDVWLIKTDSLGNHQWNRTFGGGRYDQGHSVQQTTDGGYVVAGYTWSYGAGNWDVWLIKTDSLGNHQWNRTFGGSNYDEARSVQQTTDGGYVIVGWTLFYGAGLQDVWLIRLASETSVENNPTTHHPNEFTLHPPYPNPFNPATTISYDVPISGWVRLNIYNLLGQRITTIVDHRATPGSYSVVWDAGDLPSGIYFCKMETNNFNEVKKLLLLK